MPEIQNSTDLVCKRLDDQAKRPVKLPSITEEAAFAASQFQAYYRPIEDYEGIHRWDPNFEWQPKEEKQVVRKIDARILSCICLAFFSMQLDRGSIIQALADDMLHDLGLNTNDYNAGMTVYFLCFLFSELPSQLISKRLGADRWIPIQMVAWSIVASMQAFLSGRASFFACRALLGLLEGGFIPDSILYLSYWYTGKELPARLSWFWAAFQSTSIVSAFLAYAILHLRGYNGVEGWRWLFALEGMLTGVIGVITWFYLPPSPTQTAGWFRGKKGWFTKRQEKIMVNRVLRDDPSKGDMHNRQGLSFRLLKEALLDYHFWPLYLIGISWQIPNMAQLSYLTLNIRSLGFSPFETSLLTIPGSVLFIIQLLLWTWVSEKLNSRLLLGIAAQIWFLGPLIGLVAIPERESGWVRYALLTLLVGFPYVHAVFVALTSRNAGSVRTRTVATAVYNMCVQASSVIATNIFRESDRPYYRRGNSILIALCCVNIIIIIGSKLCYVKINKKREKIWQAMSTEEKDVYLRTTQDQGNARLDFRFAH